MALRVEVPGEPKYVDLGHLSAKISSSTPHYGQNYEICPNIFFSVKDPLKDSVPARQGPRFSIRMVIGIFCSDTETGAVTPPGVMQEK